MQYIEKWDVFEVTLSGKSDGNPFTDYTISAVFENEGKEICVDGFYDGSDIYKVRFMPEKEGVFHYRISGSFSDCVTEGEFTVIPPESNHNHGRVKVVDQTHLIYEDGTPYYSIGTTCYAWVNQDYDLQEQTLETLKNSCFNKIRFCIFPKFYDYNRKEPITYPYERGNGEGVDQNLVEKDERERIIFPGMVIPEYDFNFDYYRFNLEHFRRFDLRIRQLRDMGIEADIILMHPYDRWGVNMMNQECCDLYIKYVTARFSAYRNVWWSLANEYDLMKTKTLEDWERYAAIIQEKDPYQHFCSIHNCFEFYDYHKNWITHCSMQRIDFYRHVEYTDEYAEKYKKPIVWDEIGYEGNIHVGWGNLPAQELVRRFWEAFLRGGHAGHGETYLDEQDILWWSHGGILKGECEKRLAFLLKICKETPGRYLKVGKGIFDEAVGISEETVQTTGTAGGLYEIHYYGIGQPAFRMLYLPEDSEYEIDVIDTWNMTVTSVGIHKGVTRIELPQKQYMAIRMKRVSE